MPNFNNAPTQFPIPHYSNLENFIQSIGSIFIDEKKDIFYFLLILCCINTKKVVYIDIILYYFSNISFGVTILMVMFYIEFYCELIVNLKNRVPP